MKKLFSFLAIAFFGFTTMTLTSCDEDQWTGMQLEGTWAGDMYEYNEWNGKEYWASYSEVEFIQDPFRFTTGSGYWVDYFSDAPWDYLAYHFDWTVRNRVIYIHFREDNYEMAIWDYRLTDNYFSGYINGNKDMTFRLHHTSSPNWDRDYYYGFDDYYGYYAKKAPVFEEDSTGNNLNAPAFEMPKRGNAIKQ